MIRMKKFKIMKTRLVKVILLLSVVVMNSCSTSTVITGSWKNKSFVATKTYKSVFIAGLTDNLMAKSAIEKAFYDQAIKRGYTAFRSGDIFTPNFTNQNMGTKEEMLEKIRATGADIIFTIALKDVQNQTHYVPGSATYNPVPMYGYYGSFYGYYTPVYTEVYKPGYYTSTKVYFMECNLYDATTEELIWTAQSETTNPPKLDAAAREYAALVVYQMQQDGILTK